MSKKYGWIPDIPDRRDKKYALIRRIMHPALPSKVNLKPQCPPVFDQGDLGSCTANALCAAKEFISPKDGRVPPSRLFLYYNERVIENSVFSDSGAAIRDGIKSMAATGVCPESDWPYIVEKFDELPPLLAYQDAEANKAHSYHRIDTIGEMKACLAEGFPFVFGFSVYSAMESDLVARGGELNLPTDNEEFLGGHAVMAVGYEDATQRFTCQNSWGISWGQSGFFTMPYQYLTNSDLATDFWTIRS